MEKILKGRALSPEEVKELLVVTSDMIDGEFLEKCWAYTKNRKPKYCPQDYFVLPAGKLYNDKAESTTTGRYIFNLFILDEEIGPLLGYMNKCFTGDDIEDLIKDIVKMFSDDKITSEEKNKLFDKLNWFGFYTSKFMCSSLSADFIITNPKVEKKKKELIAENQEGVTNGDASVASKIEKELLDIANEEFKEHPSKQIYDSKARGSFSNNFKQTSVMRGIVKDFVTGENYFSTSNLDEGFKPDEFKYYSDISIAGTYGRAVETQQGGYQNKIISTSYQTLSLDEKDSDCGTKLFLDILYDKSNAKQYLYRYIKDPSSGRLIELTDENKEKFYGKVVHMRSPLYCKNDKICNKCAGNYYYKMGSTNVGLLTCEIGGRLLNQSMKAFHDTTIKVMEIDIDDYISE